MICTECIYNKKQEVTMKEFATGFVKYIKSEFWKEFKEDWKTLKSELQRKRNN